jgi:hypothetical protein
VPVAVITIPSGGTFPAQMGGLSACDSIGKSAMSMRNELSIVVDFNILFAWRMGMLTELC